MRRETAHPTHLPRWSGTARLNPEDVENYKSRAQLYFETERYEESLDDLTRALKLDSKADVNDLVLQLMAVAPTSEFMERITATYQQLDQVTIHWQIHKLTLYLKAISLFGMAFSFAGIRMIFYFCKNNQFTNILSIKTEWIKQKGIQKDFIYSS